MSHRKTILSVHIKTSKSKLYNALLDKNLIFKWKVPDDMKCIVHEFNPKENGTFRISLIYEDVKMSGKTIQNRDTYHGYFKELSPNDLIIEVVEFESDDFNMKGLMTITYTLSESNGGTNLNIIHDNLPLGVSISDNEIGWKMALDKFTKFLEKDN